MYASGLHQNTTSVRNIGLAPAGVLTLLYPLSGNEKALGYNLLADETPSVKADITKAIDSKRVVTSDPFQLRQGGLGIAVRKAIFIDKKLWGFVSVVFDVPAIIKNSGLEGKGPQNELALRNGKGEIFWGNEEIFKNTPVILPINFDDTFWELGGIPVGGWNKSIQETVGLYMAAEFLVIVLFLILVNVLWTRWQKLRERNLQWKSSIEAAKPALWYLLLGTAWILFSDRLTYFLLLDQTLVTQISIIKGFAFVIVTSVLLYFWTMASFGKLETLLFLLRRIQRVGKLGYYVLDIKTGYWEGSEILNEIFGIDNNYKTDLEGWIQIVHPEQRRAMRTYFSDEVLSKKQPFDKEYEIVNKTTGKKLWVHGMGKLDFDTKGNPIRMIGTIQDITARKESDEELTRLSNQMGTEKRKLEVILQEMGDAVFVTDDQKNIIMANKALENLFGITAGEMIGKNIEEAMTLSYESSGDKPVDLIKHVFEEKIPVKPSETLILRKKDDSKVLIDGIATPIIDESQKLIGTVWVFRDVTRDREMDRLKSDFISLASHQLRTPLTGIKWFVEILEENASKIPMEKVREYVRKIGESNERMIDLVNDLVGTSKAESGNLGKETSGYNLKEMLQQAIDQQGRLFIDKDIEILGMDKVPDLEIEVDMIQLTQVLGNLLNNAGSYSPPGSKIEIGVELTRNKVKITIKDHGVGIPTSQQEKMFSKFFRADNVAKTIPGSGLGLYVAKSMVENHGGKIWFESKESKGTTFFVELPRQQKK